MRAKSRTLFDKTDLAEITDEENLPGERLIVCRSPLLADERARKREELLKATEKDFSYARREENIATEAALDGLYVIRTCVTAERMNSDKAVLTYKSLAKVKRAFRSLKSIALHIRPIRHWNDDRIHAHVFLCMLTSYVEWHMRDALRELIFDDADIAGAQASRKSVVAKAKRSSSAKQKDATRLTPEGTSCAELPGSVEGHGDAVSQPHPLRIERECLQSTDRINTLAASCAGTAFYECVARGCNFFWRVCDNISLKNTGFHGGSLFKCEFKFGLGYCQPLYLEQDVFAGCGWVPHRSTHLQVAKNCRA